MSEISVEGLRQAFLDPGSRIRLNPKVGNSGTRGTRRTGLHGWEGGFLDGAAVRFNPNLNVLVGGRGTGKSTIVESIRAVLSLDAVGDDARKAHEGIVRHVLRNGTNLAPRARAPPRCTALSDRTHNPQPTARQRRPRRGIEPVTGGRPATRGGVRPTRDFGADQEPREAHATTRSFCRTRRLPAAAQD